MKKKRLNKVLNIVVTLMAAIALMLGNVTSVAAYTALNGYPYIREDMYFYDGGQNVFYPVLGDDNVYYYTLPDNYLSAPTSYIRFGTAMSNYIYPYQDIYDYYFVGTYAFEVSDPSKFTFRPDGMGMVIYSYDGNEYYKELTDVHYFEYANKSYMGNSFSAKLPDDISSVGYFQIHSSSEGTVCGDLVFQASIVPVAKSGTEVDTLNSILQTLTQINQNIITGNTLQQQTIDVINQNTTNTSNWFTTLITIMQGWYNTQTENLQTWFYMIEERMSAGFTALYHQMTKEQDEKLNGYDDTTQSDAADNFSSESDKLTEIEGELSDQSHQYVSDFTDTGFDVGVLSTVSESLIFVTTWFTNFWNLGGIFTACLNLCFALSIVFYVLRFRK